MIARYCEGLKGKCVVITGGAGGIGAALVHCLAQSGLKTAIVDINRESAEKMAAEISADTGGLVYGFGGDVLDKPSLVAAKQQINGKIGPVDILINAAGGNSPKATTTVEFVEDADPSSLEKSIFGLDIVAFTQVFDLNFIGTLLPTMVFGLDMVQLKRGVILNISSMNSFRPLTKIPAYSAAKASINNFTQWLSVHLSLQNIRVNAIAPGFFSTTQNQFLLYDQASGHLSDRGKKIIDATPMKRFGAPEELQGAMLYLISDMSKFVTGTVLPVDGGFNAYSGV
jgi:NAD(P)-dependent dehydrogenase (short-subunit alcohol dehydrogenase family)